MIGLFSCMADSHKRLKKDEINRYTGFMSTFWNLHFNA